MQAVPNWVEIGQQHLQAHMLQVLSGMCQADVQPPEDQWDELRRCMALLHELRAVGSLLAPVPPAVQELAKLETRVLADVEQGLLVGSFERRLRGGILHADTGQDVYVPESCVERLQMESGDVVEARRKGSYTSGSPRYFFTVRVRSGVRDPDRREITGVAEREDDELCVVRSGDVLVLITAADLAQHGGRESSPVTVAYFQPIFRAQILVTRGFPKKNIV